MAVFDIFHSFR